MRYAFGTAHAAGKERIVLQVDGICYNLRALLSNPELCRQSGCDAVRKPASVLELLDAWPVWRERLPRIAACVAGDPPRVASAMLASMRWLAPIRFPRKLLCVGTNYYDHIAEMSGGKGQPPAYPYTFLKPATTTLIGSGEPFHLPSYAHEVDWEAELAVVIGKRAHNVRGEAAAACVAGYSVLNDLSARDWLLEPVPMGLAKNIDWVRQKALDGGAPMGPVIVPAEEVLDPQRLPLRLWVNGQLKQDSNTSKMVFTVAQIVEHLAAIMTLEPGDVIATGTPAGVGFARQPREFLRAGDEMVVEIEGIGRLVTPVHESLAPLAEEGDERTPDCVGEHAARGR